MRVRKLERGVDDGFRSSLVPGLKSSEDAERLAAEIAFAGLRLQLLATSPISLWAEAAAGADIEERTWLVFLIAYVGVHDGDAPFAATGAVRISWAAVLAGDEPRFDGVEPGPRGALDPRRASATIAAYRGWAERAGSQHAGFCGESAWTPQRRFERLFERLALPGLERDARFELLVSLGRLGLYELAAGKLEVGGENEVTWAAKRALGIGDPILLERRAAELADACGAPLDTLDLALHNWGSGTRFGGGISPDLDGDPVLLAKARSALGL